MYKLNLPRKNLPAPKEIIPKAFPGISQLEIDELVTRSKVNNYPAGTILCHEGQTESKFYILLDGQVQVTKTINNIEQKLLKTLEAGDFFGEMAIIHNAPRAATVTTAGLATVMEIDKENFDRVLQRSNSVSMAMVREISNRLRENDEMAIEDLKMRASELAEAYQKLAEQELTRREFLTNIAHELRTPLMAASGFLQLMQKGLILQEKYPATIETISRNIQQITTLVNDILFLQEMDLILPKFQPVNLQLMAEDVLEKYQNQAAANLITIRIESPESLAMASGDPKSLERALSALLENAIKFSPHGGEVIIRLHEEEHFVIMEVVDEGIGIETAQIPKIFDRFYQLERSGDELFGGIGLGLAITNQVIKQHSGKLTVQSQPGKGSTFSVRLKAIKVVY
ncbi:MAG: ATP-binding protein [Anaerolineales bacterium]|jgi:signal transduction histidine kinase|nr:ATP-binding protein [Anaerolineales bacterium]